MDPSNLGINQIQTNPIDINQMFTNQMQKQPMFLDPNAWTNLMPINNGPNLKVDKGKYLVTFKPANHYDGIRKNLIFDKDCRLNNAIIEYAKSFNDGDFILEKVFKEEIKFIYECRKLHFDDRRTLKEIFGDNTNPTIVFFDKTILIG